MKFIGILDYGSGNILSVCRAIEKIGFNAKLIRTNEDFENIRHIIIPGVGAFASAMTKLQSRELDKGIKKHVECGNKLLGICVGMQVMFNSSSEYGVTRGLGLLNGDVQKIDTKSGFSINEKVPNIGWRAVDILQSESQFKKLSGEKFYHLHSYAPRQCYKNEVLGISSYAGIELNVLCSRGNIFGAQFHPEKSGEVGLKFLEIFCQ